ncbi:hypothetical protein S7711_02891 [Stachybotrys chartarum IBT 7711]|uniref:Cytochrome P450 n=1 Tax=Stachybotrys chartarum (strain CBS 109288 / IBT 7711) TaxID=1280523 RepID=A0A084AHB3_STACB|nr:hypothetical protein S7711_02891 [Stachybotrys chartarum IBT 7711]
MFGHDAREEPLAPQSIPFVGHLAGPSQRKFNYYVDLSQQTGYPLFTMAVPGQKMYVITNPELIRKAQKQHKALAFPPIEAKFASTICGASREAQHVLSQNVNGDLGEHGLSMESYAAMRSALKPGTDLDTDKGRDSQDWLNEWPRNVITLATTRSVYGAHNTTDEAGEREFESGLMAILVGFLPSITAQKPIATRNKVAKAFETYYKAGGVEQAPVLEQNRYRVEVDNNVPLENIARYQVGGSIAVLVNTAPAAFWTFFFLHAQPDLLRDIRKEVDECTHTANESPGLGKSIDITTLKENSPLLLSTYQEVLRHRSMGTSVREVMEDTYFDQWLLKKGSMLQMPSRVIHQDGKLWGSNVEGFNPRRFLPRRRVAGHEISATALLAVGKTLCPGRHFVTNEVLAVVAVFAARFDMKPVGGEWKLPTTDNTNVAAVVMEPDYDIKVEVKTRAGFEDVKWAIKLNSSDKIFAMVTEDSDEAKQ